MYDILNNDAYRKGFGCDVSGCHWFTFWNHSRCYFGCWGKSACRSIATLWQWDHVWEVRWVIFSCCIPGRNVKSYACTHQSRSPSTSSGFWEYFSALCTKNINCNASVQWLYICIGVCITKFNEGYTSSSVSPHTGCNARPRDSRTW